MFKELKTSLLLLIVFTVLTGGLYPLAVTGIAKAFFPWQAEGSLIDEKGLPTSTSRSERRPAGSGKVVGSELVGQNFDDPKYLWGRLSATAPAYNAAASSGSNLGPLNPTLVDNAKARIDALKAADPDNNAPIPIDLVTASGSGLDPHISPAAADYQVARVAQAGGLPADQVRKIIADHTEGRTFGILGEPCVNVLKVNLSLTRFYATK